MILSDDVKVVVTHKNKEEKYSSVELVAMILGNMKRIAESHLKKKVENVVVSVPAFFNDLQRAAIREAGSKAGLNISSILNEPSAVAIEYSFEKHHGSRPADILVCDLGGGSFDVSLLNIRDSVKVMVDDTCSNSDDDASRILDTLPLTKAKKTLSWLATAAARSSEYNEYVSEIERNRLNDLLANLFRSIIIVVRNIFNDFGIEWEGFDEIIFVGGSSRVPKVRELLHDFFIQTEIKQGGTNSVVFGAAIEAAERMNIELKETMSSKDHQSTGRTQMQMEQ